MKIYCIEGACFSTGVSAGRRFNPRTVHQATALPPKSRGASLLHTKEKPRYKVDMPHVVGVCELTPLATSHHMMIVS